MHPAATLPLRATSSPSARGVDARFLNGCEHSPPPRALQTACTRRVALRRRVSSVGKQTAFHKSNEIGLRLILIFCPTPAVISVEL